MRIKLKLMNNFPHVQTVDLSFMEPPKVDFDLNPLGFDLNMCVRPTIVSVCALCMLRSALGPPSSAHHIDSRTAFPA